MVEPGRYFYRCFSDSSAGGLVSGKGRSAQRLSKQALRVEFKNHLQLDATVPTALVSVSSRIIDTLRRAFNKLYEDKESPNQIWIAFVHVPDSDKNVYHHAENLAEQCGYKECRRLKYEYVFTWEIPREYFMHKVSIQTLMERGLNMEDYLWDRALPATRTLQEEVARKLFDPSNCGYDIGLGLGFLARCFGARAPTRQIARQLLQDCLRVLDIDDDAQIVRVSYRDYDALLDFSYICDIEDGIDMALLDWWFTEPGFLDAYEEHCASASQIQEEMEREWDYWREAAMNDGSYSDSDIEM
ncbi:hypothetical protein K469DRAFT_685758 [Zopfia rhizophila CBS 207.26]|uniref:DUF7587 domain-containing protein n=1 Tax=Zopfia rhizophila CBS 207.26 TaxID=1314779 RepID=A0A6A6D5J4_9PEZI|nr:hypothetical protein K469DRAFT_685758 [Zopfia rhizophila CBS 207.26]